MDEQLCDGVSVSSEHLDDLILMDGPVQYQMILLGGHENRIGVMCMTDLFNLMNFHV